MAAPSTTDHTAILRRITAQAIGSNDPAIVDAAMMQIRAMDRYHRFRLASRKVPLPGGQLEHGLYLGQGAVLALLADNGVQQDADEPARLRVQLIHLYTFSHPLSPTSPPVHVEWSDRKRPVEDLRALAPRVLGPLPPPPLLTAMLPKSLASGGDAAGLASRAFAAWLADLPLPALQASLAVPPASAAAAAAATSAVAPNSLYPSILNTLWGLWSQLTGRAGGAAAGGGPVEVLPAPPAEAKPDDKEPLAPGLAAGPTQVALSAVAMSCAGPAAEAPAMTPATTATMPSLTLEEAWARFEAVVREREGPLHATESEREWLLEALRA